MVWCAVLKIQKELEVEGNLCCFFAFAPSRIPPELQPGGFQMQKYIEKDGIGRYSVVFKSAPMRGLAPSTRRRG